MIVDSRPIFDLPPSRINLIFFPNSSFTSFFDTGLILVEMFALGAASGYLRFLSNFFVTEFFGNLIAKVFLLLVTFFEILLFFLILKRK